MGASADSIGRVPQAYCAFCQFRTPHRHERLAVRRVQIARRVCLVCNREQSRDETTEPAAGLE